VDVNEDEEPLVSDRTERAAVIVPIKLKSGKSKSEATRRQKAASEAFSQQAGEEKVKPSTKPGKRKGQSEPGWIEAGKKKRSVGTVPTYVFIEFIFPFRYDS
jgi:hypothetical protein